MDVVQLRTLIHVAELGSLSKAADRLGIAQPALSRHVRLLEEELGVRLFERHGRGMVLNEAGTEVLRRAVTIVNEFNDIKASVESSRDSLGGRIIIGMPPTVGEILSVPLVRALRAAHPKLEIRFVTAFSGYLAEWLQRGELDVAVIYDPQLGRSMRARPLLLESLVLVGPPEAGLSLDEPIPFRRLGEEKMLLPNLRHGLRALLEQFALATGLSLSVDIETDSLHTLKDLVRNGFGYTVLPLAPIHVDVVEGRLSAAPLMDPVPARKLLLAYPPDRSITRAARSASDHVSAIVDDLVRRGVWKGEFLDSAG